MLSDEAFRRSLQAAARVYGNAQLQQYSSESNSGPSGSRGPSGMPPGSYTLRVKVRLRPRETSSIITFTRDGIDGFTGKAEVAVGARPIDGGANRELRKFLSEACGIRKTGVQLLKGMTTKEKVVLLQSTSDQDPFRRLSDLADEAQKNTKDPAIDPSGQASS